MFLIIFSWGRGGGLLTQRTMSTGIHITHMTISFNNISSSSKICSDVETILFFNLHQKSQYLYTFLLFDLWGSLDTTLHSTFIKANICILSPSLYCKDVETLLFIQPSSKPISVYFPLWSVHSTFINKANISILSSSLICEDL